jgi:ABC-type nickel/cobalt efflux system permease component RcnA
MIAPAWITLLVGFVLGLKHSTEADHVVAVSTLVSETHGARRGALVGAFWGLGHLLTIFAAGGLLVLLHLRVPPRVEWALELLVALVLIGLGTRTIRRCLRGRYHFHVHEHGSLAHAHLHFHARSEAGHEHAVHAPGVPAHAHRRGALLVGMAHGLAGTAGLTLLVLSSIPSRALGLAYLLVFGLGAMSGMAVFSALLGLPLGRAASRFAWLNGMRFAAGTCSCVLGVFLVWRSFLPAHFPF